MSGNFLSLNYGNLVLSVKTRSLFHVYPSLELPLFVAQSVNFDIV